MHKCDKCGKIVLAWDWCKRFIDGHGYVDLCNQCENEIAELIDRFETEWFEKGRKE